MTSTYQNSPAPSPFQFAASSSSSHNFFYSTTHDPQDQSGYYHKELPQPLIIQQDQADNFASHGGSYDIENESSENGLKFSIWKKEDKYANHQETPNYQVKWMSSKMRMMHKMKNVDRTAVNAPPTMLKLEDQKQLPSSPMETENSSNSSSNNSNSPIRVCSDCNTTKTPLWRSGPQGPKSLCNACGIRQRKARRAMAAAAAAAANGTAIQTEKTPVVLLKTTKTQQKDKRSSTTTGHVAKYKKKSSKLQAATNNNSSHQAIKKPCFEDFLLSLRKNLAFHRVFPQDEKEAAILLMALSCGHVHG